MRLEARHAQVIDTAWMEPCYNDGVLLPFNRARMRARNVLDDALMRAEAAAHTPSERVEQALALSQTVRELAHATGADRLADKRAELLDLMEKSRLYAEPLRRLDRGR